MLDSEKRCVYCDSEECSAVIQISWAAPDSPIWNEMSSKQFLRFQLIENGWLIDLHGINARILVGEEGKVPGSARFSQEELKDMFGWMTFGIEDDQHYCSSHCVREAA